MEKTDTDSNIYNTNDKKSCCAVLDYLDDFWLSYKHHSGKISLGLSILAAGSSILVSQHILLGSVALGLTNSAVFFSSIAYEKLNAENQTLHSECESVKQQNRRLTLIPRARGEDLDDYERNNEPQNYDTPQTNMSIDTIEPVNFEKMHENNKKQAALNSFAFPQE